MKTNLNLLSLVYQDSPELLSRREHHCARLRRIYQLLGGGKPDRSMAKIHLAERVSGLLRERSTALHLVEVEGYRCRASFGAIADWRSESLTVEIVDRDKKRGNGSGSVRDGAGRKTTISVDSIGVDADRWLAKEGAKVLASCQGFTGWSRVAREARLDEDYEVADIAREHAHEGRHRVSSSISPWIRERIGSYLPDPSVSQNHRSRWRPDWTPKAPKGWVEGPVHVK